MKRSSTMPIQLNRSPPTKPGGSDLKLTSNSVFDLSEDEDEELYELSPLDESPTSPTSSITETTTTTSTTTTTTTTTTTAATIPTSSAVEKTAVEAERGVWKNAIKSEKKTFAENSESIGIGFHKEYETADFFESPATPLITVVAKPPPPTSTSTSTTTSSSTSNTSASNDFVGKLTLPASAAKLAVVSSARAQSVGIDAGSKIRQQQRQEEFMSEYNNLLKCQVQSSLAHLINSSEDFEAILRSASYPNLPSKNDSPLKSQSPSKQSEPLCSGCSKRIESVGYELAQQFYHSNCAKCEFCKKRIHLEDSSTVSLVGDRLACSNCVTNASKHVLCTTCHKPITAGGVMGLGKAYHSVCLVCFACREPLADSAKIYRQQDKPSCGKCVRRVFHGSVYPLPQVVTWRAYSPGLRRKPSNPSHINEQQKEKTQSNLNPGFETKKQNQPIVSTEPTAKKPIVIQPTYPKPNLDANTSFGDLLNDASVNTTAPIPIARDKFAVAKVDNSVVESTFSESKENGKKMTTKEWNARAPLITPSEMSMPRQNIFGFKANSPFENSEDRNSFERTSLDRDSRGGDEDLDIFNMDDSQAESSGSLKKETPKKTFTVTEHAPFRSRPISRTITATTMSNYVPPSRPDPVKPKQESITSSLGVLLQREIGVEFFLLYLIRTYDVEILLFWLDVQQYKAQTGDYDLNLYAQSIWTKYLDDEAELSIRDKIKETTVSKIELEMVTQQSPSPVLFDEAQREIFHQMSLSAFPSFLKRY
eukprot:TRINITY_DN4435_c0_g1_i1.p1 TRINITY_DN4435_c0_g1~~TRINITY_DN4435_c0_g1_i1.p1  ORF type:complete len:839 (+),score=127.01 TRINITY_DN4435_c0_g1_i1:234-2519(+)